MSDDDVNAIRLSVDVGRMIEVLASQIYPSPFALLRENVQNAFDAIMLRRRADVSFEPMVDVLIEPRRIEVRDNGIGMTRAQLRDNFWTAGSSSKNTDEARAAGVVGTFGIGAMANFGIAERLEVVSESTVAAERTRCVAERATLSAEKECISFERLDPSGIPGTQVVAMMQPEKTIEVSQATAYITEFVRFLDIDVRINGTLASRTPIEMAVPALVESWRWDAVAFPLGPEIVADVILSGSGAGEVRIDISSILVGGTPVPGRMILRQGVGGVRTFRSRFGLAAASISSTYGLGGIADFLALEPTAGREALTTASIEFLNRFAAPIDELVTLRLSERPEANSSPAFVSWVSARGRWDLCGMLRARIEPGDSATLNELRDKGRGRPLLVYAGTDPAIVAMASTDRAMVLFSRDYQRRRCEEGFLQAYCAVESLSDEPRVLKVVDREGMSFSMSALAFRLAGILNSDYFLPADVRFGKMSHDLPILVSGSGPVVITLDASSTDVALILEVHDREYGAFGHMTKDFARSVVFPRVAHLVPSATRLGAQAFLKSLQRTRDVFEYERSDLESLRSLWTDYLGGKVSMAQATARSQVMSRSYQTIEAGVTGRVREIVPDLDLIRTTEPDATGAATRNENPLPPIQRLDIATDCKLLTISDADPPLKEYRCFLALTKRIREERGDFLLQPHRTSIVWGGQKILFIFEHQSGEVGLYYDVQMMEPVAASSGGGIFETCTIVMKDQTFIPIPEPLRRVFLPAANERKKLEVRCDLLFMETGRQG